MIYQPLPHFHYNYLSHKSMCHLLLGTKQPLVWFVWQWAGTVSRARVAAKLFIEEGHYDDTSIRADLNTI